jgi:hypothetical protein
VFSAAQRSVLIVDTDQDARAVDAFSQAMAAVTGSSDHSVAVLWAPGTDLSASAGGFADALVSALARTGVIDADFSGTLNERLAKVTDNHGAVLRSSGSPVVVPPLEAIPSTSNDLAGRLRARGDLIGAKDLYQNTYDAQRRILGPDHLDTLASASRLADVMRALGDYLGARELDERNEALRRRLQDEDQVGGGEAAAPAQPGPAVPSRGPRSGRPGSGPSAPGGPLASDEALAALRDKLSGGQS